MGRLHHWFSQAEPEEQGSFCNADCEHVNNMSAFDAEVTSRTVEADGARTLWWDGNESMDTRYNHQIVEKENELVLEDEYLPAKYRPGR